MVNSQYTGATIGMVHPQCHIRPDVNEVREAGITQAAIEALHQLRHTWHEVSYLLEATCMLVADKTSRSYAAEIWIERVGQGSIDSGRIGSILGSHQHTGWGPLKRLTDLIQQQMIKRQSAA